MRRLGLARFRRKDHFGPVTESLADSVRELIKRRTGATADGAVFLLTNLSSFGYCFNPICVYYCYNADNEDLRWVVLEVTNTPWSETTCYVLDCEQPQGRGRGLSFSFAKQMHVSPFIPMEMQYDCWVGNPGETLGLAIHVRKGDQPVLETSLALTRRPINGQEFRSCLIRHPAMALQVTMRIHWQALKLWCKRVPLFSHPEKIAGGAARP